MSLPAALTDPPVIPKLKGDGSIADVAIVGAGPVGLFAAFYAGLRSLSAKLVDSAEKVGGQLSAFYPDELIYDVPGHPGVRASDLADLLTQQAAQAQPIVCLRELVQHLEPVTLSASNGNGWQVVTDKGSHLARTVILAVGAGRIGAKRLPASIGERFEGHGLHYRLQDVMAAKQHRVLVVGGAEVAVSAALTLSTVASHVTLIHHHPKLAVTDALLDRLRQSPVDVRLNCELVTLDGTTCVTSALLNDRHLRQQIRVAVEDVYVQIGYDVSLRPIQDWKVEIEANGIRVEPTMQTSLPGVFAAGDIAVYPGKIKLIAIGLGEAAIAINHVNQFLKPNEKLFPGYSTTIGPKRLPGLRNVGGAPT